VSAWTNAKLGEIFDVNIGRTPARNRSDFWEGGHAWLSIADMNQGRGLRTTKETITDLAIRECNCRPAEPGTVLLSFKLSIGKVGIAQVPLYTNEAIAALPIQDRTRLCVEYLYWALQSVDLTLGLDRAAKGLTLNKAKLLEIGIPLPPLAEQWRIAEVLDRAEALQAKRGAALAQLDSLTQSLFLDLFGDPATNPKGWPRKPIGEIGKVITGNTPPRANPGYYGTHIEWIKSDNINTPHYYLTKASEGLSESGKAVARTVPAGSILVTCIAGSPECIGNAAMTDREVAFNQQINAFVPVNGNADFLYAQMLVGKRLIQEASTAGMKGMVSKGRFERITLVLPPIELQREFARRVTAVEKLKTAQRASLAELDALFATLQHRAFRGEL
jgi:type I restriction enzyme S subunit